MQFRATQPSFFGTILEPQNWSSVNRDFFIFPSPNSKDGLYSKLEDFKGAGQYKAPLVRTGSTGMRSFVGSFKPRCNDGIHQ